MKLSKFIVQNPDVSDEKFLGYVVAGVVYPTRKPINLIPYFAMVKRSERSKRSVK